MPSLLEEAGQLLRESLEPEPDVEEELFVKSRLLHLWVDGKLLDLLRGAARCLFLTPSLPRESIRQYALMCTVTLAGKAGVPGTRIKHLPRAFVLIVLTGLANVLHAVHQRWEQDPTFGSSRLPTIEYSRARSLTTAGSMSPRSCRCAAWGFCLGQSLLCNFWPSLWRIPRSGFEQCRLTWLLMRPNSDCP